MIQEARVRAARVRVETVRELAAAYIAEYAKPKKRSWKKDEQILDREVIPFIGRKRVVDVTRQDIREDVLRQIVARGAPVRANHTLEIVRKMFNWAIQEKDLVLVNPAALLPKTRRRHRRTQPIPLGIRIQAILGSAGSEHSRRDRRYRVQASYFDWTARDGIDARPMGRYRLG